MRTETETATLDPDTWYACPRCGTRQRELAMFCDGGRRHRPTAMRRVDTIDTGSPGITSGEAHGQ